MLTSNFLNPKFEPKTETLSMFDEPNLIEADSKSVCISTKFGSLANYKFPTLDHLWTVKIGEKVLKLCMDDEKIIVVASTSECFQEEIIVIDRVKGKILLYLGTNCGKLWKKKVNFTKFLSKICDYCSAVHNVHIVHCTLWKNEKFALIITFFRQINSIVIYLVNAVLSRESKFPQFPHCDVHSVEK